MKKQTTNRIMLAAPGSGSGKTTVTCALLKVLKDRGMDVAGFKCGPDYIDPLFHKKILGVESRNLDTFFAGEEGVRKILSTCSAGVAVIEGVMGLYDGLSVSETKGSAYEIADLTDTPIILVVDASGIGRTVISLIKGMLLDDTKKLIRGVILNRITESFYEKLKPVLEDEITSLRDDVKLHGFLPKDPGIGIKSRHLGLMLPGEIDDIKERIEIASSLLEAHVDLDGLLTLMDNLVDADGQESMPEDKMDVDGSTSLTQEPEESDGRAMLTEDMDPNKSELAEQEAGSIVMSDTVCAISSGPELTLAVAYDEAFCFYYKENLEMFEKLGVKIRYFSPLHDEELFEDADGILLGGGYPENHLERLSNNTGMRASIKEAIENKIPSLAECGGFMYLHRTIADREGREFEMAGVIDGACFFSGHLVRFGYLEVAAVNSSPETALHILPETHVTQESDIGYNNKVEPDLLKSMVGLRGHEFHYYESSKNGEALRVCKPDRSMERNCMVSESGGIWGFLHFYYPSAPDFVKAFAGRMKEYKSMKEVQSGKQQ